ncbi:tyrosine-type recombinase/integrase [Sphingomonas sp.]|uniref:tyrosine-type recombinase/integrase n=1 Tax=Sphingomonas sp. TaxID=28214 RepID=UPI0035A98A0D
MSNERGAATTDRGVISGASLVPVASSQPLALQPVLPELAPDDHERVAQYVERASSPATLRAYRSDWADFAAWCAARGYLAMPATPEIVAAFVTDLAAGTPTRSALSRATIGRKLAAIVFTHRAVDVIPPTAQAGAVVLDRAMRTIRKDGADRPVAKKRAADGDILRDMLRSIEGDTLRAVRDRALLAIGMSGAFRRSEIVALQRADVKEDPKGLRIVIRKSKTDQEAKGHHIVIPNGQRIAPVALLDAWLQAAKITDGFVFRKLTPQGRLTAKPMSAQGVAIVVKQSAQAAGYDAEEFSGHSLRAGFLTAAGSQGASVFKMSDQSRHKSLNMIREYVRDHDAFRDHAGDGFL